MPTDRAERRLLDSIRAASEALRAAALDIEEHSEERGGRLSRSRDADQVSAPAHNCAGCAGERDEHGSADAGPTLPPYPPMPPYPPYPPMPPIVILCGSEGMHGVAHPGGFGYGVGHPGGFGYGVGHPGGFGNCMHAGWPAPPVGAATGAAGSPGAPQTTTAQAGAAPRFQPPSADNVPAGGMSFPSDSPAAAKQPDPDG